MLTQISQSGYPLLYILGGIIILIILVGASMIMKKRTGSNKSFFECLFILILLLLVVYDNEDNFEYYNNPATLCLFGLMMFSILVFACFCYLIFKISRKKVKTKRDIINRQTYINGLSYFLVIVISCFCVGLAVMEIFKPEYSGNLIDWIGEPIRAAFFLTMALILCDSIISRICSPVLIVEEIPNLESFNLYLRSFDVDGSLRGREKMICRMFNHLFPTYAIGDPNSMMQPNGARRIYATDEEWKNAVFNLMKRAQCIVIRCSNSMGTKWELDTIMSDQKFFKKCVFIIDSPDSENYIFSRFRKIGLSVPLSKDVSATQQYAAFISDTKEPMVYVEPFNNEKDVEDVINLFLKSHHEVDQIYSNILDMRHNYYKKLFSKDIPNEVRSSLNWGILSPLINFRHWPLLYWIIFIGIGILGVMLIGNILPICLLLIIPFILGNRIEWTQFPDSGTWAFLKKQRRESSLMWSSSIFTVLISVAVYIICKLS